MCVEISFVLDVVASEHQTPVSCSHASYFSHPLSANHGNETQQQLSSLPVTIGDKYESSSLAEVVLHEVVLCIGHLCSGHADNQTSLQQGPPPTLLHQLVSLPFVYFSRPPFTDVLYPTLCAFCYTHTANTALLRAEINPSLLANYIEVSLPP